MLGNLQVLNFFLYFLNLLRRNFLSFLINILFRCSSCLLYRCSNSLSQKFLCFILLFLFFLLLLLLLLLYLYVSLFFSWCFSNRCLLSWILFGNFWLSIVLRLGLSLFNLGHHFSYNCSWFLSLEDKLLSRFTNPSVTAFLSILPSSLAFWTFSSFENIIRRFIFAFSSW